MFLNLFLPTLLGYQWAVAELGRFMKLKPLNLSHPKFVKMHHSSTGIKRQYKETRDEQAVFQSQQTINTRTNAYCNMRSKKCLESSTVGRPGVIQTSWQACTLWVNHIMYVSRKVIK